MRSQFLLQNHKGLRNQWFRNSLGRRPISKKLGLKTLLAIYFPPIDSLCSWHDLNKTNYVSHQSKDHTKTVQVELFWRNINRYLYFTLFVNIEISSNIGSWYHYKHKAMLLFYQPCLDANVNSMAPGGFERQLSISCEIALKWMLLDLGLVKSTLVQVIVWCRQATSHYLHHWWPRYMSPYGITRPQWVKVVGSVLNSLAPGSYEKIRKIKLQYSDVIMSAMSSQIIGVSIVCSPFLQAQIKENIITPRHWSWWIPLKRATNAENVSIW